MVSEALPVVASDEAVFRRLEAEGWDFTFLSNPPLLFRVSQEKGPDIFLRGMGSFAGSS